jgi:hypothetical protein
MGLYSDNERTCDGGVHNTTYACGRMGRLNAFLSLSVRYIRRVYE